MTTDSSSPCRAISERRGSARGATRRGFLLGAAAGLGFLSAGCTVPVRSFRAARSPVVAIPVDRFPELDRPGGTVKVILEGAGAVFVRREDDGRYTGLSAVCTHQRCIVDASRAGFRCPCHGSTFDRQGLNTGGPAPRPLERFEARRTDGVVELLLGGSGSGRG